MYNNLFFVVTLIAFYGVLVEANSRNESRCFQFTWLGPRFHNGSVFLNATCRDATRLAAGIPCEEPLVASYDGTWPDVNYIWTHHREASCSLAKNDVCAKITYYFDGHVENSTYLCTRAVDANNTAVSLGCYQETKGSFSTRVCLCRSTPGAVPCNSANRHFITFLTILIFVTVFIFNGPSVRHSIFS